MTVGVGIKNIVFDLGGVIINLDYNRLITSFEALGITNFRQLFTQAQQIPLFDKFDKGQISPDEFRQGIKDLLKKDGSTEAIDKAWNAILLDVPKERLDLLQELKGKYRLFLLSNTNKIHMDEIEKYYQRTFGFRNLKHLFEKEYLSFEIGKRKPDAEIFIQVLEEQQLNPGETLFIDDSIQHIEGASKLGIQTHFLKPPQTILELDFTN